MIEPYDGLLTNSSRLSAVNATFARVVVKLDAIVKATISTISIVNSITISNMINNFDFLRLLPSIALTIESESTKIATYLR